MFQLFRMREEERERLLARASVALPASPPLLTLTGGISGALPRGFAHDLSQSEIGRGLHDFAVARRAFLRWEQFALGWVRVVNPTGSIEPGSLVAVEAHTVGLWSINLSRVMEVADEPTCFGFLYATTEHHVEQGQERFVLMFDPESGRVTYLLEAISRPRHPLARIGYPFARWMQHRFARDSHSRMRRCVQSG